MNCQKFEELLGAYTLEALSEDERRAADAHLAECAKCTRTVQQLQTIVDLFPLSVPARDPSPRVKAQVISRIQADKAAQETSLQQRDALFSWRERRWRWNASLLAASVLLLLVLLGGVFAWNISLRQQVNQLSTRVPPPVTYTIHGAGASATASGQVIYYPQQHITVLILRGLPQLTGTHVYQGWLLQGNQPYSIGLLNVQNGVATLDFQGSLSGYDATAVSLENGPMASSNAPKGPVVALGKLQAV